MNFHVCGANEVHPGLPSCFWNYLYSVSCSYLVKKSYLAQCGMITVLCIEPGNKRPSRGCIWPRDFERSLVNLPAWFTSLISCEQLSRNVVSSTWGDNVRFKPGITACPFQSFIAAKSCAYAVSYLPGETSRRLWHLGHET